MSKQAFMEGFFTELQKQAFLATLPRTLVPVALQQFQQAGQVGDQLRDQEERQKRLKAQYQQQMQMQPQGRR